MGNSSQAGRGGVGGVGTRVIHLDGGQRRGVAGNLATVMARPLEPSSLSASMVSASMVAASRAGAVPAAAPGRGQPPGAIPYEALFRATYGGFCELGRSMAVPGLLVAAVHVGSGRLAGRLWLRGRCGQNAAAIVGRHDRADLFLDADPALSLRHLLIVLRPVRQWRGSHARYSVLDLRTADAFRDEKDRQLSAVCVDGPAVLRCAGYALFLLPTGDPSDWPEDGADAWQMLPERVYLEECDAEPDRWQRAKLEAGESAVWPVPQAGPRAAGTPVARGTMMARLGPMSCDQPLLADGEDALGTLWVLSGRGARRVRIGRRAAVRGVLLGRYSRCDSADLLGDENISRAHLLLLSHGDELIAIDIASTNGSYVFQEAGALAPMRLCTIDGSTTIHLADHVATVRWEPASG